MWCYLAALKDGDAVDRNKNLKAKFHIILVIICQFCKEALHTGLLNLKQSYLFFTTSCINHLRLFLRSRGSLQALDLLDQIVFLVTELFIL